MKSAFENPFEGLKRCPFCNMLPVLYVRGGFWRGGCEEHLPEAIMQPVTLPLEAKKQWNHVIDLITGAK